MEPTVNQIRAKLDGLKVLVVEDDNDLAPRVKELLTDYSVRDEDITMRRCVVGETEGGVDVLSEKGWEFDVILVDIMLPMTEVDLAECDKLQDEWEGYQTEIARLRGTRNADKKLDDLKARLRAISEQLQNLIDREAGITMIKQWLNESSPDRSRSTERQPAVLFLTARQQTSLSPQLEGFSIPWRWLTKPAQESQILAAIVELLSEAEGPSI